MHKREINHLMDRKELILDRYVTPTLFRPKKKSKAKSLLEIIPKSM
jgi:hypothetical protein